MTHQQQCEAFLNRRKTLLLSTLDKEGVLETSVAPFVFLDGLFYIYISELAKHTQNCLWQIEQNRPQVSALLVADESETEQLFARERITLQLNASELKREQCEYILVLQKFADDFGDIIGMLSSLPDFHLITLTPINGGYVRGFGQAFAFESCPCQGLMPIKRS